MKYPVYNQEGKEVGQTLLAKKIFEVEVNPDLVHQIAVSQMARKRISIAKVKTRAEVRGGGKKPWAQKGTGRARHGSIRSPLWRGGGVTFGPTTERVFKKKIPKKMGKKALFMVLSAKAKENSLLIIDSLKLEQPKTKLMVKILKTLRSKVKALKEGSILIALPQKDESIIRASRNISKVQVIEARSLNVLNLLSLKYLIISKEALKVIEKTFLK